MRLAILTIVLVFALSSQTAKVVVLQERDAIRAADAWRAKLAADAAWEQIQHDVMTKYHLDWNGVAFSEDFKAVVPKPVEPPAKGAYVFPWDSRISGTTLAAGSDTVTTDTYNSRNLTVPQP